MARRSEWQTRLFCFVTVHISSSHRLAARKNCPTAYVWWICQHHATDTTSRRLYYIATDQAPTRSNLTGILSSNQLYMQYIEPGLYWLISYYLWVIESDPKRSCFCLGVFCWWWRDIPPDKALRNMYACLYKYGLKVPQSQIAIHCHVGELVSGDVRLVSPWRRRITHGNICMCMGMVTWWLVYMSCGATCLPTHEYVPDIGKEMTALPAK